MNNNRIKCGASIYLNVLFLIAANLSSVFAAPNLQPPYQQPASKKGYQKHIEIVKGFEKLQRPVEFSDLPTFTKSTTFIGGYLQPMQNGVSSCQMKFFSQESPQTVVEFYKNALPAYRWNIIYMGSHSITARHADGHVCTINVTESKLPKTKSKFVIAYRQIEKQH